MTPATRPPHCRALVHPRRRQVGSVAYHLVDLLLKTG
jgi:hypothetical protein